MGRKTHGPLLAEAIESNNLRVASEILSKYSSDKPKLQQLLYSPVPRPIFESSSEIPVLMASSLPEPTLLNYLVTGCGADPNRLFTSGHPKRRKQTTCLIVATRRSSYGVVNYLLNVGCDPNRADHKGRTPLHHAVRRADFAMAKLLLSKGSSHDRTDSAGNAPLHVATLYGHLQLVKLLVKSGADLYQQGHFGALPLHMAAREGHVHLVSLYCCTFEVSPSLKVPCYDGTEKSPLQLASQRGHWETARALLEECGALVDSRDPAGNTALHYCFGAFYDPLFESRSKEDHAETARVLLESGADPNARNADGEMPLHLATKNCYEKGIEVLLAAGAQCGDESRNVAGSRPLDLAADKSGASASMLRTAARDPRAFANETAEAMSRRGWGNSGGAGSTNASFAGSSLGLARLAGSGAARLPAAAAATPTLASSRSMAGRAAGVTGAFGRNGHPTSLESIERANQLSRLALQIDRSLGLCAYDEDGYLAPQEVPYIDDQTIDQLYKERLKRLGGSPTRSDRRREGGGGGGGSGGGGFQSREGKRKSVRQRSAYISTEDDESTISARASARVGARKRTPVSPRKSNSENGSSVWEVTPTASTALGHQGAARRSTKRDPVEEQEARNLSNVFEERSESESDRRSKRIQENGRTVRKIPERREVDEEEEEGEEEEEEEEEEGEEGSQMSDYDSFDTISESEEETLKRNRSDKVIITRDPRSPVVKQQQQQRQQQQQQQQQHQQHQQQSSRPVQTTRASQKRQRSSEAAASSSSSFESETSSSNSAGAGGRRAPPPIPRDQSPFELEEVPSCKKLFNLEMDGTQLADWTVMKFSPVLPSRSFPSSSSSSPTYVVKTSTARRIARALDDERFLNRLTKNGFDLLACSTDDMPISAEDLLGHEYENTAPGPNSVKYVVKLCLVDNRLEWSKEVVKPPTMPKKKALERIACRDVPDGGGGKLQSPRKNRVPNSETDSFTSGTSSSSNEINSFVPKEARKKAEHLRQNAPNFNQSGTLKRGFGLQKGGPDAQKSSKPRAGSELEKSPKGKRQPLKSSQTKANSASAEDILEKVERRRGSGVRNNKYYDCYDDGDFSATYLNHEDARRAEMKHAKSQQNVLSWFSASREQPGASDGESEPYKKSPRGPQNSQIYSKSQKTATKQPTASIYEQLEDDSTGIIRDENGNRRPGKPEFRIVLFEKSGSLGFSITGGNIYGIVVESLEISSEAMKAGLRIGDELVEFNGRSLEGRTKEEAHRMMDRWSGRTELKVKRSHERRIGSDNGDRFFVQACFDSAPDGRAEKSENDGVARIRRGEIFCVLDSMPQGRDGYWKAYRAESRGKEEIFIPNKSKATGIMARSMVELAGVEKKSKGQSLLRSFRRNKSIDVDARCSEINSEFLKPYKNVILVPPHVRRPVFIAGLFSDSVCRRLIADSPGLFEIPDRIVEVNRFAPDVASQLNPHVGGGSLPRSASNSSLSPVDVEPLREISARGKHALCCLSPNAIEFVRQRSDLDPIAIFLSCPDKQVVRDVASALNVTNVDARRNGVASALYENSVRFQKYYGGLFDAVLSFRSDASWFSILKDTIGKMQVIPKWRTVELLDEEEGGCDDDGARTLRKRNGDGPGSENNNNNSNRHSKTTDDLPEFSTKREDNSLSGSKSQRKSHSKLSLLKSARSMSSVVLDSPD